MARARARRGVLEQYEEPCWDPLMSLLGRRLVADFMWMHEVKLLDGTSVHAYKHIDTRRYIHLDQNGQASVYEPEDRYRPMAASRVLSAVFGGLPWLAGVEGSQVEESWAAVDRLAKEEPMVLSRHSRNH
jgi:hypothetical protein